MVNVAAQIALEGRRRAPVVYAPGRAPIPAAVPQRGRVAPQRQSGVDWVAASQAFANTKAAQQQQAQAAQPKQQGAPKGLGFLLGAMNVGFGGLQRGVTLANEEYAEAMQDAPDWLQTVTDYIPSLRIPKEIVDTEKTEKDERSNWEKVFGLTSDYGGGQILKQTGNKWVDRGTGFAYDMISDPLNYLSAGTTKLVEVPEQIIKVAAKEGAEEVLHKIPAHTIKVPIRAGRRARLHELGQLGEGGAKALSPEDLSRLTPDIIKAGREGFANTSPELRQILGIQDPKLQFMGLDVPGSAPIAKKVVQAGGKGRALLGRAADAVPGISALGRGPKGMEAVTATLAKGGNQMPMRHALRMVQMYDAARMAGGRSTTRMNTEFRRFVRKTIDPLKRDKTAIQTLVRETETPGSMTPLNELMGSLATIYQDVTGTQIDDFLRDKTSYLPHMRTPGFKRMVKEGYDKNDPFMNEFVRKVDFYVEDLLERSGFLEKSRKLTPDIDPETGKFIPKTLKIGPYEMTLRTGTIEELNTELRKLFPSFKGDFYETDPVAIVESYISSISKDAGGRAAVNQAATPGGLVQRMEGPLLEALNKSNEVYAAQNPMVEWMAGGPYVPGPAGTGVPAPGPTPRPTTPPPPPGAAIPPVPAGIGALPEAPTVVPDFAPPPKMPEEVAGVRLEDYFVGTKAENATNVQTSYLRGPGREWVKAAKADVRDTRQAVAKSLYDVRKDIMKGLTKEIDADESAIDVLTTRVAAYEAEIKSIGAVREETHDQLVAFLVGIRKDIADLEAEITREFGRVRSRINVRQNRIEKGLNNHLASLRKLKRRMQSKLKTGPARFRTSAEAEIKRLMEPVTRAQARVDAKAASVPGKVTPEALVGAQQVMKEMHGAVSGELGEQYAIAMRILESADFDPMTMKPRTKQNRLTPEQMAIVEEARETVRTTRLRISEAYPYDEAQAALAKMTKAADAAAAAEKAPVPVQQAAPLPSTAAAIPEAAVVPATPEFYSKEWWDATRKAFLAPVTDPKTRAAIGAMDDMQLRQLLDNSWELFPPEARQPFEDLGWSKKPGESLRAPLRETKTIDPLTVAETAATPGAAAAPTPKPVDKNAMDYVPETLPEIRRKRDRLRRMFERGGQHYEEYTARRIIAQHEQWKRGVDNVTRDERKLLDLALERANADPRLARQQKLLNEAQTAQRMQGEINKVTEKIQAGSARQKAMADETITRRGARGEVVRRRGFDPERDVKIPMEERALGEEKIKPLATRLETAKDVEYTGLETQRHKLRQMDEDASKLEANVEQALNKRQTLIPRRAENERLRKQLQGTARNLSLKSKEAATQRAVRSQKLGGVIDDVDSVAKANPLMDDDALAATESLLHTHRADIERTDKIDITQRQAQKMIDMAGRKGDSGLAPVMLTTLNDQWHMLHDGILAEGDIIIDAELHRRFQNIWSELNEPSVFGRTFNALTNLFKTYATLTPGFHVRNALSAMFMNMSDGVPLRLQYQMAGIWKQYMEGGDEWLTSLPGKTINGMKGEDIQRAIGIASGTGAGGRFTETGFAATSENEIIDRLMSNRLTRRSQRRGERVEGAVRVAMAMDSVAKGETDTAAMHRINRIHFDYSEVSALDQKAKQLIPFWTYMSRNLPMQMTQMVLKPRVYAQYAHAVRNFSDEPEQFTPEYWLKAGAFNLGIKVPENNLPILGAASGLPIYMSPDLGFTRLQQDVENIEQAVTGKSIGGLMSNVNPLVTAPAEYYTRQDFFTGQQFPEGEGFEELGGLSKALLPLATVLQQTNEIGQVDPRFMNAIRAVNPLLDRTSRLAPQLMGGKDKDRARQAESIARFFGVPMRTLTPEQQQSQALNEYYDARSERERQLDMMKALLARTAG